MKRLKQIRIMDALINEKILEIDRLRTLATKVNCATDGERVQTSKKGDSLCNNVVKIVDLQNEIKEDIDKLVDLKKELMTMIDALDDQLLIGILYKRYFQFETLEDIAEELGISRQWVSKKLKDFWSNWC